VTEKAIVGIQNLGSALSLAASTSAKKILQTEQAFGFIMCTVGGLITIICDFPGPLLTIESAKAPVMRDAVARTVGTTPYAQQFPHKARGVCVDGHPSHKTGERLLAQERKGWSNFIFLCELHLIALVLKDAFQFTVPYVVQGLLYTALAVCHGEFMEKFREALYQEVLETLDILDGAPTKEAVRYRQKMIKLFMGSFSQVSVVLASCLPNGDWRVKHRVQFYPSFSLQGFLGKAMKRKIAHFLAVGLLKAFLPQTLRLYARHHWTGLDVALDQQGALESCHSLFSRTTRRFLDALGHKWTKTIRQVPLQQLLALGRDDMPLPLADAPDADQQDVRSAPEVVPDVTKDAGKPSETEWAKENTKRRTMMADFWSAGPLWILIILRSALEPLRELLTMKFKYGSWAWEATQRAKAAKATMAGQNGPHAREYRAYISATNKEELQCALELKKLMAGPEPWKDLLDSEPKALTLRGRGVAFRILTRAAAGVHENLMHRHRQYPWITLRLPIEPHLAPIVLRDAKDITCKGGYVDAWTKDIVTQFPTEEALRSDECKAIIFLILVLAWADTGLIEPLHAMIRRLIQAASVHTHLATWADVQSGWLMGSARRMLARSNMLSGRNHAEEAEQTGRKRRREKKATRTDGSEVKVKIKVASKVGGMWRAFLRRRLWACGIQKPFKTMMETLRQEYHSLPANDDTALLRMTGAAATAAGHMKKTRHESSFGPRPKDIARENAKAFRLSMKNRIAALHDSVESISALKDIQTSSGGVDDVLKIQRAQRSAITSIEMAQMRADARALVVFDEGPGQIIKDALAVEHPDFDTSLLVAVPAEVGHCFWQPPAAEEATDNLAKLTAHWNVDYGNVPLMGQIDGAWGSLNECVREKDVVHAPDPPDEPEKCNKAGMCVCVGEGKALATFGKRFHTIVCKPQARAHTPGRVILKEGRVAYVFIGSREAPAAAGASQCAAVMEEKRIILHIPLMCLSPWRPVWHELIQTASPVGGPPESASRMFTKVYFNVRPIIPIYI